MFFAPTPWSNSIILPNVLVHIYKKKILISRKFVKNDSYFSEHDLIPKKSVFKWRLQHSNLLQFWVTAFDHPAEVVSAL